MSDIKRYDPVEIGWSGGEMNGNMKMTVDGDYVSYEDHLASLEAVKGTSPQDHEARIKALEECISPTAVMNMYKRIDGLEKALNEHMVKERECKVDQRDYISRLGVIQDAGYSIIIDPKASPKGIPFEVALAYAKAGRKIRRAGDIRGDVYAVANGALTSSHRYGYVDAMELLVVDWGVIPEKQ